MPFSLSAVEMNPAAMQQYQAMQAYQAQMKAWQAQQAQQQIATANAATAQYHQQQVSTATPAASGATATAAPAAAAAAQASGPLPANWTAVVDPTTKATYYFNSVTRQSQWTAPVAPGKTGPAGPVGPAAPSAHQLAASRAAQMAAQISSSLAGGRPAAATYNPLAAGVGMGASMGGGFQSSMMPSSTGARKGPYKDKATMKREKQMAKKALEKADFNDVGKTELDHEKADFVIPDHILKWRESHSITVAGNCPMPLLTFEEAGVPPQIMMGFQKAGFTGPSAIQSQSWPAVMQNRDVIGVAKTGSGKTLGFLFPVFLRLLQQQHNTRMGPYALVLAPTRELAVQIEVCPFSRLFLSCHFKF